MPPGFDFEFPREVMSFTFVFQRNGAQVKLTSNTDRLTPEMKEVAQRFTVGDWFLLEDIKVKMPDGPPRYLPGFKLEVE